LLQCILPRKCQKRCWCCPGHGALPGQCFCPISSAAKTITYVLATLSFVAGAGACAGCVLAITVYNDIAQGLVSMNTLYIAMAASGCVTLLSPFVVLVTCKEWTLAMNPVFLILLALAVLQAIAGLALAYWVYALDGISYDMLAEIVGESSQMSVASWVDQAFATPMSVIEGFTCTAYQRCCRDPALDNLFPPSPPAAPAPFDIVSSGDAGSGSGDAGSGSGLNELINVFTSAVDAASRNESATCAQPHEGTTTDVVDASLDPSSAHFCAYLTGAPVWTLVAPPAGVCPLLEASVAGLSLSECQANFCPSGVDGHVAFVELVLAAIRRNAIPLGAIFCTLVLLQVIYACNVRSARLYILEQSDQTSAAAAYVVERQQQQAAKPPAMPQRKSKIKERVNRARDGKKSSTTNIRCTYGGNAAGMSSENV